MYLQSLFLNWIRSKDAFLILFAIPIIVLFIIDSNHFILGWNEGAGGGFLFAFVFLILEWYDARKLLKFNLTIGRCLGIIASVLIITGYFAIYSAGNTELLSEFGAKFGYTTLPQILSWTRMWDYIIYAIYISLLIFLAFGIRKIKYFPTPIVFLLGMAFILLLDATFPYGSMQSLQVLMQPILTITVLLLTAANVRVELVGCDNLAVWGQKGFLFINMYWQCAGILSMTIYLLVILILMIKLHTSLTRKLIYAAFGAIGTFFINIIRIFLIIYYGAFIDVNLRMFHESIGEVLFTIWIVIYLLIVTTIETRRARNIKSPVVTQSLESDTSVRYLL
jgi:thaumarchaeosortase